LFWKYPVDEIQVKRIALPLVSIFLVLSLYFVNIKPIMTNVFLIEALKSLQTPGETTRAIGYFQKSYRTSRLGQSEVVEHIAANSISILTSDISIAEKNAFYSFARDVIIKQTENSENDARYELIAGSFLSSVGVLDEAITRLERTKELMPAKHQTYFELGAVYINKSEPLKALEAFRTAYELAPEYTEAKIIYLIGAIYAGDRNLENKLISELPRETVSGDNRILSAYKSVGR
jgi:tetratricopeptide (TPR) repeat protein